MFRFFKYMIRFRKKHRVLRANISNGACGFPDISFHGVKPWKGQFAQHERYVGILFAGQEEDQDPEIIYIASNAYWEELKILLPELPEEMSWQLAVDTWKPEIPEPVCLKEQSFTIRPRTLMVWKGVK